MDREDAEMSFGAIEGSLADTNRFGEFDDFAGGLFAAGEFGDEEFCCGVELEGLVGGGWFLKAPGDFVNARFAAFYEIEDLEVGTGDEGWGRSAAAGWGGAVWIRGEESLEVMGERALLKDGVGVEVGGEVGVLESGVLA